MVSKTKKLFAIVVLIAILLTQAVAEERSIFVVGFDFTKAEVILEDEDGFLWSCPFGKNNWKLGEEFKLVLIEGQDPEITEID